MLSKTGWAYRRATAWRMRGQGEQRRRARRCVGAGLLHCRQGRRDAGTALALARMLIGDSRRVAFLSRGYGGDERAEPLLVGADSYYTATVSEPLLLAKLATVLGWDRSGQAQKRGHGADALILDDGLQNPGLIKDLSFAVVDGGKTASTAAARVPAGPLRAPFRLSCHSCRR